ncbi:MAG: hypothetical protein ACR2QW_17805, partial [bacterium]
YQRYVTANYVSEALGKVWAGRIPEYIKEDLTKENIYSLAREIGIRPDNKFQEKMLTVAVFCDLYAVHWKEDQARKKSKSPPKSGAEKRIQLKRTKSAINKIKKHLENLHPDFIDETIWLAPDREAPVQRAADQIYLVIDITRNLKELVAAYSEHLDQVEIPAGTGGQEYQPGRLAAEALGYFLFGCKPDLTRNDWIDTATRILERPLVKHGFENPSIDKMVDRARKTLKLFGLRVAPSQVSR